MALITNTLHAANKPHFHFYLEYSHLFSAESHYILSLQKIDTNLPMINQSGSMLDFLQVREEYHAVKLNIEGILHMADCVYTVSICYRSFDANMLMTSSPNITQFEYN